MHKFLFVNLYLQICVYRFSSLVSFSFVYLCLCGEVGGGGIADDHAIAGIASEGDGGKEM